MRIFQTVRANLAAGGERAVPMRALVLAGGWWALTEGDPAGLAFGVVVVLLALFVSVCLPSPPPPRWNLPGLLRLGFAFLTGSLHSGLDVARRALAPGVPLSPAIVRYALRLPQGPARNLLMGTLSLMPGTLSANLDGHHLEVHVLVDKGDETVRQLQELEALVARALGAPLESADA
jgi:multicomponent Na+:H+ antiporter subunit E